MASTTTLTRPNRGFRPRALLWFLGWAIVIAVGAWFYLGTVSRYIHFDALHYGHHWHTRWWLVAHLGGGSLSLIVGPLQFSSALRRRYVNAHRWIGRAYLAGVLISSLAAIYISLYVTPVPGFGVAMLFLTLAWVTTSSMALTAALRRQFAVHREWMIRSYVVTFGFVVFRLLKTLDPFHDLPSPLLTPSPAVGSVGPSPSSSPR